eukprot:m51a1_g10098 hypothetical protein (1144) ;mRNA; f:72034-77554
MCQSSAFSLAVCLALRRASPNATADRWYVLSVTVGAQTASSAARAQDSTIEWENFAVVVLPAILEQQQPDQPVSFVLLDWYKNAVVATATLSALSIQSAEAGLHRQANLWDARDPSATWGTLRYDASNTLDARESPASGLFVGIDTYSTGQYLRGACNDALRMERAIGQFRNSWSAWTSKTLLNEKATREAIRSNIAEKVAAAGRGGVVLFYFSGLGTIETRANWGTPGKIYTSLCPYDAQANGFLSPIEFHDLLTPAVNNGVTVVMILDCCFTGNESLSPLGPGVAASEERIKCWPCSEALRRTFERVLKDNPAQILDFAPLATFLSGLDVWENIQAPPAAPIQAPPAAPQAQGHRSLDFTSGPESICVGSVLDTLHVGVNQVASAHDVGAEGERWVDIARGAHAFGQGIVEAAKKASASRDVALDTAALQALESMTREQWAAVARQAIELEPRGMCEVLDSVAGGLDASPARRHLLMRSLSDAALVNALLAAESNWREHEAALVLDAGGDKEKLRGALKELPYQRKLQLLYAPQSITGGSKEVSDKTAEETASRSWEPWVVSYRTVLHDSVINGKLCDMQIQVVPETTARAEASTATWLPADGNLADIDSVHAFAAVRSVVDAMERVLRGTAGIDKEECLQELEALDEGRSWGERTSKGLRWQAGQRLVVDTRATGVTQPMYSRRAGALLFPLLRISDGGAAGAVPTSRSMEAVAHTAGHAVLDALRPRWAEGIEERPEGGVLHEVFADLVGLLVGTGTAAVSGAVAAQTRCDVRAARVAGRQAAWMAEAVGLSGMRSARSTLTARDVWWPQTGLPRQRAGERRWSSREVSAMVTSAVWAAVASELARRCRRSRAEGKEGKEGRTGPAEEPAEVLSQLAKQALAALVAACMRPEFRDGAPTLVDFCDALVCDGSKDAFREALRCELERRFLLSSQWKQPYPRLEKGSIEHTSATVSGFLLLASSKDKTSSAPKQQTPVVKQQPTPVDRTQRLLSMAAPRGAAAANVDARAGGPARRMCECIAVAAGQAGRTVECPVSRQLWATLRTGAQQALDDTEDEAGAWEALVETWGRVEREAAGQVFGERRMWSAIVVEAADEPTVEGRRASVRKLVLSLEYVVGCCNESPSLALWRRVLASFSNTN